MFSMGYARKTIGKLLQLVRHGLADLNLTLSPVNYISRERMTWKDHR
jgi:hypothetical protein